MAVKKTAIAIRTLAVVFLFATVLFLFREPNGTHLASGAALPQPPLGQLWHFQCVDTMKYSRDAAREFLSDPERAQKFVTKEVEIIKSLGATCVGVATPYDAEFLPFLKLWADTTHAAGLKVWFRGNFSGWENWFDYPYFKSPDEHHVLLTQFVTQNPDLFQNGDILSPAPEAENGMLGNPWASAEAGKKLRDFVWKSADTCQKAITAIGKNVSCGYFSANGDVARDIYNKEVLQKAGAVTAIDHYIRSTTKYGQDLDMYFKKHGLPIVVGEFGAPIGDINGSMSEAEQAQFVGELLRQMYTHKNQILGINYWVLRGGSTALLNVDGTERKVMEVVRDYFIPGKIQGRIVDGLGRGVKNAVVSTTDGVQQVTTDAKGNYSLSVPIGGFELTVTAAGYTSASLRSGVSRGQLVQGTMTIHPQKPNLWYRIRAKLGRG